MADETKQPESDLKTPEWEKPVTVSIEMPWVMRGVLAQMGQKSGKPAERVAYELIERQIGMWVEQARHLNEQIAIGDESGEAVPMEEAFPSDPVARAERRQQFLRRFVERNMPERLDEFDRNGGTLPEFETKGKPSPTKECGAREATAGKEASAA